MQLQLLRSLDADLEESSMLAGNEGRGKQCCKLCCVEFVKLEKWIEAPKSWLTLLAFLRKRNYFTPSPYWTCSMLDCYILQNESLVL
jgi:hypothetical protein